MIEGDDLELFAAAIAAATERVGDGSLDGALLELGWRDALEVDTRVAVSLWFEAQGRSNATSSALSTVLAFALGVEGTVLLPDLDRSDPPGRFDAGALSVRGFAIRPLESLVVVASSADGAVACDVASAQVSTNAIAGLDPAFGLVEVTADATRVEGDPTDVDAWNDAVRLARLALAHELIGASRTMLDLARTHALERIQFGRPIARFQAVRHRLAEAYVAIETAEAMADAAWLDPTLVNAVMAKALAGRGARTVAKHCQQVLAGIGFTTEHDLHRHVRRVHVLDELFGSARTLTRDQGDGVLADRGMPPLVPL